MIASYFLNDTISVSMQWIVSLAFSICLYIFVWLPFFLCIGTVLMLYNVHRRRSFDINCRNVVHGLVYSDICCVCRRDSKDTTAKFHGVPTHEEDDRTNNNLFLEMEVLKLNDNDNPN